MAVRELILPRSKQTFGLTARQDPSLLYCHQTRAIQTNFVCSHQKNTLTRALLMAVREGFEPSRPVKAYSISSAARSTRLRHLTKLRWQTSMEADLNQ